uniref:ULP_PROTEASE domain-containing protein n=1 Tax=Panagrellus redivivus TaxID=6233 RepID=A0A7E4ZTL1_PANRE
MPHQIVWVEKVVNSRASVLTHAEVLEFVAQTKTKLQKPRATAEHVTYAKVPSKTTVEAARAAVLEIRDLIAEQNAAKPALALEAELEAVQASTEAFKKAVMDGALKPTGMPVWRQSSAFKKEMMKARAKAGKSVPSVWKKINNMRNKELNSDALRAILDDDDENVTTRKSVKKEKAVEAMEVDDDGSPVPDLESSDEDEVMDTKPDVSTIAPIEPTPALKSFANDRKAFADAADAYQPIGPVSITFEGSTVVATPDETAESLANPAVANMQFTDHAINAYFGVKTTGDSDDESGATAKLESKLSDYNLSKKAEKPAESVVKPVKTPSNHGSKTKTGIVTDMDIIADPNFRKVLVEGASAEESDLIYAYLGVNPVVFENGDEELELQAGLVSKTVLNSIWTAEELDLMEYRLKYDEYNALFSRQRTRVQHPFIAVPPRKTEDESGLPPEKERRLHTLLGEATTKQIVKKVHPAVASTAQPRSGRRKLEQGRTAHNTVIHCCTKFLEKNAAAQRSPAAIGRAYQSLSKLKLTFVEKLNYINTAPKTLPNMLMMLDDIGLRFGKDEIDKFEQTVMNLYAEE